MKKQGKNHLILAAVYAALFAVILICVRTVDVAPVGPEGTEIGLSHLNVAYHNWTGVHMTVFRMSEYCGYLAIAVVAVMACAGLIQFIRRKSLLRVDRELLALGALFLVLGGVYILFKKLVVNYRPVILPGEAGPEASFPSSHTMLACVVFGSAAMLLRRYLKAKAARTAVALLCELLAIAAVLLRLNSGAHWLTDVAAGAFISAALLELYAAALGMIRAEGSAASPSKPDAP